MQSTIITIGGMSCGGCAKSIAGLLHALPGVIQADVSLEQARAKVEFDPARVSHAQLTATIEAAGFEAS